jgi:hypothetical protein
MISFGIGELEWIYSTRIACECAAESGRNTWAENHGLNISAHAISERDQALIFWCAQLSLYSKRALTYGRDKLPAISGLARVLARKIGSRYLAGLWEEDLPRGLAWEWQGDGTDSSALPSSYRAPSWSWASVDGKFEYPHIRALVPLLKAYEGQTTPKDNDPYGEIFEGEIKVQAAIFPVVLYFDCEVKWRVDPPRHQLGIERYVKVSMDGMPNVRSVSSPEGIVKTVFRSKESINMHELDSRLVGGASVFAMPVAFFAPTVQLHGKGTYALLILTASLQKLGCFERVGFTTVEGTNRQLTERTGYSGEYQIRWMILCLGQTMII